MRRGVNYILFFNYLVNFYTPGITHFASHNMDRKVRIKKA
jgi:hypothetical protein